MRRRVKKDKPDELSRREIIQKRRKAASETEPSVSVSGYRINRTISRDKERQVDSDRQAWHDLRTRRKKLLTWLAAILLVVIALFMLLTQLVATVVVQTPSPISGADAKHYTEVLTKYLEQRPLERLRFLTHQDSLERFFATQAPEVSTVRLAGSPNLTTASLQLTFREPVAEWSSESTVYFVDGMGVTFERNHFDAPSISVKDNSNLQIEAGQAVLDRRFLSFLGHVVSGFTDKGLVVQEVILPDSMLRQVDISIRDKPYVVRMTIDREADAQVGEAMHAIKYMDEKSAAPQYIDVRVDRRVFYK